MSSPSAWFEALPEPGELLSLGRAFLAAEAAYETHFGADLDVAASLTRLDDGVVELSFPRFEGDQLLFRFGPGWSMVVAYDHESGRDPWRHELGTPTMWPGLAEGLPDHLLPWLKTPWDEEDVIVCTAIAWWLNEDPGWRGGRVGDVDGAVRVGEHDDGVGTLIEPFLSPARMMAEIDAYLEPLVLGPDLFNALAGEAPLTARQVQALGGSDVPKMTACLRHLGYQGDFET